MPGAQGGSEEAQEKLFTTLADLLTPASSILYIESTDAKTIDRLLQYLPPSLVTLAQDLDNATRELEGGQPSILDAAEATLEKKKDVLRRVLRSPQFSQSLSSLTIALRDGGLPTISEALHIPVRDGGYLRRGGVPLGGGEAVEAFVEGVRNVIEKEKEANRRSDPDREMGGTDS